jgi:hypothetical protein
MALNDDGYPDTKEYYYINWHDDARTWSSEKINEHNDKITQNRWEYYLEMLKKKEPTDKGWHDKKHKPIMPPDILPLDISAGPKIDGLYSVWKDMSLKDRLSNGIYFINFVVSRYPKPSNYIEPTGIQHPHQPGDTGPTESKSYIQALKDIYKKYKRNKNDFPEGHKSPPHPVRIDPRYWTSQTAGEAIAQLKHFWDNDNSVDSAKDRYPDFYDFVYSIYPPPPETEQPYERSYYDYDLSGDKKKDYKKKYKNMHEKYISYRKKFPEGSPPPPPFPPPLPGNMINPLDLNLPTSDIFDIFDKLEKNWNYKYDFFYESAKERHPNFYDFVYERFPAPRMEIQSLDHVERIRLYELEERKETEYKEKIKQLYEKYKKTKEGSPDNNIINGEENHGSPVNNIMNDGHASRSKASQQLNQENALRHFEKDEFGRGAFTPPTLQSDNSGDFNAASRRELRAEPVEELKSRLVSKDGKASTVGILGTNVGDLRSPEEFGESFGVKSLVHILENVDILTNDLFHIKRAQKIKNHGLDILLYTLRNTEKILQTINPNSETNLLSTISKTVKQTVTDLANGLDVSLDGLKKILQPDLSDPDINQGYNRLEFGQDTLDFYNGNNVTIAETDMQTLSDGRIENPIEKNKSKVTKIRLVPDSTVGNENKYKFEEETTIINNKLPNNKLPNKKKSNIV